MGQIKLNGPLLTSVLCLLAVLVFVLFQLPTVARAVLMPSADEEGFVAQIDQYRGEHERTLESYQKRFDGRSVFFKPPQPRPVAPKPKPRPPVKTPPRDDAPPVERIIQKPSYAGPKIMAMLGDEVWFHGTLRVRVGEEKQGIKVLSTDPPWSAALMYSGWEYEVPLWDHIELPFEEPEDNPATTQLPGLVEVAMPAAVPAGSADEETPSAQPDPVRAESEATSKPEKDDDAAVAGVDVRLPAEGLEPKSPPAPPDSVE